MSFARRAEGNDQENALLAALVMLHRRKQQAASASPARTPYERVVSHFEQRGQRLRAERVMTEELIGRLFQGARSLPAAPLQQELEIAGAAGATAAGRFRLTSRAAAPATIDLVVGDPLEPSERLPPALRFDPPHPRLSPGETTLIRVQADLTGARAGDRVVIPIECRADGRRDRLWLVVSALPGEATR